MARSLASYEMNRLPWGQLREASGPAVNIPVALVELFDALTPDDAGKAYWKLENHVVVQGQLFGVAEFVVPVLMAALLDERPDYVKICVLELLFQIVSGVAHEIEIDIGNIDLAAKCQQKAREGLWILYRELIVGESEAAREVIEIVESEPARLAYFLGE
ncbi:hypothetical protein [Chitinimonas sp. JJ19]|uniref:hypothetical protein n=1 Tax=Chitinimonas sp. JJ19 TaxID=3109352 RepID=UPI003002A71C